MNTQTELLTEFFTAVIDDPIIALDQFLKRGVRPKTADTDNYRLRPFLQKHPTLTTITPDDVDKWQRSLEKTLNHASRQSYGQTLKSFFNWCVNQQTITLQHSPAAHLKVQRRRSARNKAANETDVLTLIRKLEDELPSPAAARDLLAVRLYYESGNRLTEIATLTRTIMNRALRNGRLSKSGHTIYIADSDEGKKGSVPIRFTEKTAAVYRQWQHLHPHSGNRVFVAIRTGQPIQPAAITNMIVRRCKQYGIQPFRTHAIRHLKGTKTTDQFGPAVTAAMLSISFEVAQMHYYDEVETAVLEATTS